jgi:hypothetical protein
MHTEGQSGYDFHRNGQGPVTGQDWDWLLHPAGAYSHPKDVVADEDLTLSEKRAILASWASDASAVNSEPSSRKLPIAERVVPIDEVMDALRSLDALSRDGRPSRRVASGTSSPWRLPPVSGSRQNRTARRGFR